MSPTTGARHLADELAAVKTRLLEMSTLAEDLLARAGHALAERDGAAADRVIADDTRLDVLEVELDEACVNLLARQQPVARDLRLITMAMRISNDLERIGDHAVNIAEAVHYLENQPDIPHLRELDEMARIASGMLTDVLDAFIRSDATQARDVLRRDDQVDRLVDSVFRVLLTHMLEDPRRISPAISLILVSRNLERVADLATNIGEDVVFLVEGRSIKHGPR
jgi:phosphate transport system protein